MRVEAIVKDGGLFIPKPGFPTTASTVLLVDIEPVPIQEDDAVMARAAGILAKRPVEGVKYQQKLRREWDRS